MSTTPERHAILLHIQRSSTLVENETRSFVSPVLFIFTMLYITADPSLSLTFVGGQDFGIEKHHCSNQSLQMIN